MKQLIGMVHLRALPGTPASSLSVDQIVAKAVEEAVALRTAGFDAILIENMHDAPYLKRAVGPEIVAAMTTAVLAIRRELDCPLGVQVLAGANREALAIAHAAGAQFIRAEGFVFAHVADEGLMQSDAGELLRYRRAIGAQSVHIYTDIKKKHSSHAITADIDIADTAHAAEFFGADAVIVTGTATGCAASTADVRSAKSGCSLPVLVGSGVDCTNLPQLWPIADGFIIGSCLKQGGQWQADLDPTRITSICNLAAQLRS